MTKSTKQNNHEVSAELNSVTNFDPGEFEKRLAEVRQEFHDELSKSVVYKEPAQAEVPLNFNIPAAAETVPKKVQQEKTTEAPPQSSLLASLAQEARQSLQSRESLDQDRQGRNRRMHEALQRVLNFFLPFAQHVNAVAPSISRTYRLDARSVYANLKWQGALVDSRKQSMSDAALLSYVSFSVYLQAPEPILLKRPWNQYEALVKELAHLKIRTLEDLHEMRKSPKQEWLEAHLDPALPLQILFQGNYEMGKIEILTRNLADFGQTGFRLEPAEVSAALLDELGLFLIGRTDKLPMLLCATPR